MRYKINCYNNVYKSSMARKRNGYSIDQVDVNGSFVSQIAFWFQTESEAKKRLSEILEEDKVDEYPEIRE